MFERLLELRNDVGLLAEEYDPRARRQLGNFPQAFSHIALINTAYNLSVAQRTVGTARRQLVQAWPLLGTDGVEGGALDVEPGARRLRLPAQQLDQPPETARMVEFAQMGDLVGGEIVEHHRRRHHQPPGERQVTAQRARAPAAGLVAQADRGRPHAEARGVADDRRLKVALGFPFEEIDDAAAQMRRIAGNEKDRRARRRSSRSRRRGGRAHGGWCGERRAAE